MITSQASALAELSSTNGTVNTAIISSTAGSASAVSPALNSILDTKSNKERQEVTIILMGGSHEDPSPCFFLSQYLEQNAKRIQDARLRIEMGFETSDVDPEENEIEVKLKVHIRKIVEWLGKTRLKIVSPTSCTENDYSYTQDEVADFIISNTEMDSYFKRFFLKKIYENFTKFSRFINFWNSRNEVLAEKAHVNLFQQLLKYGISSFPLEPVSVNETDYVSAIFEKYYAGEDGGTEKVEKERIDRMVNSIGKSIKKLATTGGLIVVPSLGLSHMHRLEAYISDAFKYYSIRIKSFAVMPPNYGVLIRYNNNTGNEKHWISAITDEDISVIQKKIDKVDSMAIKKYYSANPYVKIMIKQNEKGEFLCPAISDFIDSIILKYSSLPLLKEIFASEEVKSQKEFQLLKGLIAEESLVEDNSTVKGSILAKLYHYSLKLKSTEEIVVCWQITQIGYAFPGMCMCGLRFSNSNKIMTLLRIQKGAGYDFGIEYLSIGKEKGICELKLLVFPVPIKNYHGLGIPPVTVDDMAKLVSGPRTIVGFNCTKETLWTDHILSPAKEFFHLKERDQALQISSRQFDLSQSSQTNLKTSQTKYEILPLEANSIIKWRNPSLQQFFSISQILGGMSYRVQAGLDKNSEIALKVTQYGYAKPGELWVGVCSGTGKPILTLLKLYKQEGQDFYIDIPSLKFSKEQDSDHFKMEARVAIYNIPHENYLLTAYGGKRYKIFYVNRELGDNWQEDPFYPPEVFGDKTEACVSPSKSDILSTENTSEKAKTSVSAASMVDQKKNLDQKPVKETRNAKVKPKENPIEVPIATSCNEDDIWQVRSDYPVAEQYTMELSRLTQLKKEICLQAIERELEREETWEETSRRGTQLIEKLMTQQNTATAVQSNKNSDSEGLNKIDSDEKNESEVWQLSQYKAKYTSNRNVKTGETKYTIRLLKDEEATASVFSSAANGGDTAISASTSNVANKGKIKPKLALKASEVGSSKSGYLDLGIKADNTILPLFRVKKTIEHDFKVNHYSINSELTEVNFSVVRTNINGNIKGKEIRLNVDTTWKEDTPLKEKVHSPL